MKYIGAAFHQSDRGPTMSSLLILVTLCASIGDPAAQILFTIGDHFEGLHIQRGRSR